MVRLFVVAGLLVLLSLFLLLVTGLALFRWLTLILAGGILLLFFFLRRGLAPDRGRLRLAGLLAQVEVHVDDQGVPHIYARNQSDLYRAQGFITARDRLFAMELTRRAASGRLSELLGERLLPGDRLFRTLGLRRKAETEVASLPPHLKEALEAYAAGVNARINTVSLPPEFTLLRFRPEPWTSADCLAVARYISCSHTARWTESPLRVKLLKTLGPEKTAELFPVSDSTADLHALAKAPLSVVDDLLHTALAVFRGADEFPHWAVAAGSGSAWALAGSRTASGKPLLAIDLYQPPASPARWYQVHLVGPEGLDVTGASLPGLPGVLFGHNRDVAWGLAGFPPHQADLSLERCTPASEVVKERIRVRGMAEPVDMELLVSEHGPVIAWDGASNETTGDEAGDSSVESSAGAPLGGTTGAPALALRWAALEAKTPLDTILSLNRARSWADCQAALEQYQGPPVTLMVACRDGTTAKVSAGTTPLAVTLDPEEGFLLPTAEALTPKGYRALRAAERFSGATEMTAEKLRLFQADVVNLRVRSLLKDLLSAVQQGLRAGTHPETLNDVEKRALLMLSGWDGTETPDSPQPALWHEWFHFLVEEIFRPQMGRALYDQFVALGQPNSQADRLIRAASAGQPSLWLAPEGEGSLARVSLRSFRRAVALLAAKQGNRPDRWRWGREHQVSFPHPLAGQSWFARLFLGQGPFPAAGSALTVNPLAFDPLAPFQVNLAATWRQVADLSAPEENWVSFTPGQSEHPFSTSFSDHVATWLKGEYKPALYRHGTIRQLPSLTLLP